MSGATPDKQRRLFDGDLMGDSENGKHWASMALHPNSETVLANVGIPDRTSNAAAKPQWSTQGVLTCPAEVTTSWDACIIVPPVDGAAALVCCAPSGADFTTSGAWGSTLNPGQSRVGYLPWLGRGGLNTTAYGYAALAGTAARNTYQGITVELVASALNNQGTVYAWQGDIAPSGKRISVNPFYANNAAITVANINAPLGEGQLVALDPRTYVAPAADGVYMPMRSSDPEFKWQPTVSEIPTVEGNISITFDNQTAACYRMAMALTGGTNGGVNTIIDAMPRYSNVPATGQKRPYYDFTTGAIADSSVWNSYFTNKQTGVIIFRGLSPQAKLQVKARMGEEMVVKQGSPLSPWVTSSPAYDPRALDQVIAAQHKLELAFPASYNAFGLLAPVIFSVLRSVGGAVAPTAKMLAKQAASAAMAKVSDHFGLSTNVSSRAPRGVMSPAASATTQERSVTSARRKVAPPPTSQRRVIPLAPHRLRKR